MKNLNTFEEFHRINEAYDKVMLDAAIEKRFLGRKAERVLEEAEVTVENVKGQLDNFKKDFSSLKKQLKAFDKKYDTKSYFSRASHSSNLAQFKIVVEVDNAEGVGAIGGIDEDLEKIAKSIKDSKSMYIMGSHGHGYSMPPQFEFFEHVPGWIATIGSYA